MATWARLPCTHKLRGSGARTVVVSHREQGRVEQAQQLDVLVRHRCKNQLEGVLRHRGGRKSTGSTWALWREPSISMRADLNFYGVLDSIEILENCLNRASSHAPVRNALDPSQHGQENAFHWYRSHDTTIPNTFTKPQSAKSALQRASRCNYIAWTRYKSVRRQIFLSTITPGAPSPSRRSGVEWGLTAWESS